MTDILKARLGRARVSTVVLVVVFGALFWVNQTFQPETPPAPVVVPPGFVPDPNYTWVPRTDVRQREPQTTTTTTTTSPTDTTTTNPTSPTPTTTLVDPDGAGPLPPQPQTVTPTSTPPTPTTPATPPPSPTTTDATDQPS